MSDDDLDRYLAGDSELSSLYNQSRTDARPSALTEARLLRAARETAPVQSPRPQARRWWLPVSAAASMVLATSLYLLQPDSALYSPAELPPRDDALRLPRSSQPAADAARFEAKDAAREAKSRSVMAEKAAVPGSLKSASPTAAKSAVAEQDSASGLPTSEAQLPRRLNTPTESATVQSLVDAAPNPASAGDPMPPQVWLQQITELLLSGQRQAASTALAAFHRQYPGYPLPAAITDSLGSEESR
ncbi:hypothetical protein [Motiliproteus sediminis]|uniref:hypothetical protein n=1 Tax=Motiliproteus sediminis TaxID=1468178 RepID=UPI001AEF476F|nr:hypothetical protein [Motiliproteus sediminis]